MRVETKAETIVKEINTYIADDGEVFVTREACEKHEKEKAKFEVESELERLAIRSLEGIFPLHVNPDEFSSFSNFKWYSVNNRQEAENIDRLYEQAGYICNTYHNDITYPTYYGVEENDNEMYPYTLEEMQKLVATYFKNHFNIIVEYKKGE